MVVMDKTGGILFARKQEAIRIPHFHPLHPIIPTTLHTRIKVVRGLDLKSKDFFLFRGLDLRHNIVIDPKHRNGHSFTLFIPKCSHSELHRYYPTPPRTWGHHPSLASITRLSPTLPSTNDADLNPLKTWRTEKSETRNKASE